MTTSDFTRGARETREQYGQRGIGIELWDAERFYDRLRIAQRSAITVEDLPSLPCYTLARESPVDSDGLQRILGT